METLGCAAKVQLLRDRHEITEMPKFNIGHEEQRDRLPLSNTKYISIAINKILDILIGIH